MWYCSADTLFLQVSKYHHACPISKKYTVNRRSMSLSTFYLEHGCQFAWLHCRHHCHCVYAPTSNTARHDNHEKINSWVSFSLLYEYGALLSGHCQNSAITGLLFSTVMVKYLYLLCQFAFFVVHTKHLPVRLSQIKIFIPALDLNQCMFCEIYKTF